MNLQARYDLEIEKDRLGTALDVIQPLSGGFLMATDTPQANASGLIRQPDRRPLDPRTAD